MRTSKLATLLLLGVAVGCAHDGSTGAPAPGLVAGPHGSAAVPRFSPGSDEVWVFAETDEGHRVRQDPDGPRSGQMVTRGARGEALPVPLEHTEVHASLRSYLSTVDLHQRFHNPYATKIEAVYVFPLPHDAAVRDFVMEIGDRRIRGIIRPAAEAKQIYLEARAQGYRAALLDQARPNVFEQSVANIEPGRSIDVRMRYFHALAFDGDEYEFVFPMVVGPRYNPPGWRDGVGAESADRPGSSGQPVGVAYATRGTPPANRVSLTVDVDAGMPIEAITSPSHRPDVDRPTTSTARIVLEDAVPDRDFVLRYRLGGADTRAALLTQHDERSGYFTMLIQPPHGLAHLPRQPMEIVFVVDCSGSMSGAPLRQAKCAIEMALDRLDPRDTFQIICFSEAASSFSSYPLPVTERNIDRARHYLSTLAPGGGTRMLTGIRAALEGDHDPEKLRFVAFLTDGYIGNEVEIFSAVRRNIGQSRIFSLGVGSAVNRYLLEGLARIGRGAVGYLLHDEDPGRAVAELYDRITHPAMTDVHIDWGGAAVADVHPKRIPDLFVGRPIVVTGRFHGAPPRGARVVGRVGGYEASVAVRHTELRDDARIAALPAVWARSTIQHLADFAGLEGREVPAREIERLALTYGLMSDYTSFVAVDATGRTAGEHGTTVQVPVPMPAGVRYDTTVGGH